MVCTTIMKIKWGITILCMEKGQSQHVEISFQASYQSCG